MKEICGGEKRDLFGKNKRDSYRKIKRDLYGKNKRFVPEICNSVPVSVDNV